MTLLYALLLFSASHALGWVTLDGLICRRWPISLEGIFRQIVRIAAGSGILAWIAFFALAAHHFPRPEAIAFLFLAASAGIYTLYRTRRDFLLTDWNPRSPLEWLGLAGFLIAAGFLARGAWTPALSLDSFMYHLPVVKQWVIQGGIQPFRWYLMAQYNLLMDVYNAWGFQLDSDDFILPKMKELFASVSIGLLLLLELRRRSGPGPAWFAAIAWLLYFEVVEYGSSAYIDLTVGMFYLLGMLLTARAMGGVRGRRKLYLLSGIFFGLAVSTKITLYGLWIYAGIAWLLIRFYPYKRIDLARIRRHLRPLPLIIIPVVLFGLPWMIKNLIVTGSPFMPLLTGVFPPGEEFRGVIADFRMHHQLDESLDFSQRIAAARLFLQNVRLIDYSLIFTATAVALLVSAKLKNFGRGGLPWLALTILLMMPMMLFIETERFLFGPVAIMLLLIVRTGGVLVERLTARFGKAVRILAIAVSVAFLGSRFHRNVEISWPVDPGRHPIKAQGPLWTPRQVEANFFAHLPRFDLIKRIERQVPPDGLLLNTELVYDSVVIDAPMLPYSTHHRASTLGHMAEAGYSAERIRDELKTMGVTHIYSVIERETHPEVLRFRDRYLRLIDQSGNMGFYWIQ